MIGTFSPRNRLDDVGCYLIRRCFLPGLFQGYDTKTCYIHAQGYGTETCYIRTQGQETKIEGIGQGTENILLHPCLGLWILHQWFEGTGQGTETSCILRSQVPLQKNDYMMYVTWKTGAVHWMNNSYMTFLLYIARTICECVSASPPHVVFYMLNFFSVLIGWYVHVHCDRCSIFIYIYISIIYLYLFYNCIVVVVVFQFLIAWWYSRMMSQHPITPLTHHEWASASFFFLFCFHF